MFSFWKGVTAPTKILDNTQPCIKRNVYFYLCVSKPVNFETDILSHKQRLSTIVIYNAKVQNIFDITKLFIQFFLKDFHLSRNNHIPVTAQKTTTMVVYWGIY